jgi:hypothetical protein
MKNTQIILLLIFLTAGTFYCGQSHNSDHLQVILDNGKKWSANPETTTGIKNMIALMDQFTETDRVSAYKELGDGLQNEFDEIFKNCTMKGEAHDQLHNYLLPMVKRMKMLKRGGIQECKESFLWLSKHLASYETYFI